MKSTTYNAANELTERDGKALGYDAAGNLTSDGSNEYTWNARGQLASIAGATSASFAYDPFGRRIEKTLGETTTAMLYDGPNVVQESSGGSTTADLLTGLMPDQLFSRTTSAGTSSYLTDRLGSVIGLGNGSAEVPTTYTYSPFGTATEAGEASGNPFQFTGRENDGTGLQYNRARYYDPQTGRFISRDPSGFAGSGPNLYAYAAGDPLDYVDPYGLSIFDTIGGWVSEAASVASEVGGSLLGAAGELASGAANGLRAAVAGVGKFLAKETDLSTEELIGAIASELGGTAMCGIAAEGASAVGTPVAGVAAYGFCTAIETIGAYETVSDLLDHNNELWTNELFR